MVAAELWLEEDAPRRPDWVQLVAGLLAGLILGIAVAVLAGWQVGAPAPEATAELAAQRSWPHRALDREWRSTTTPVDVDRMFRRPR